MHILKEETWSNSKQLSTFQGPNFPRVGHEPRRSECHCGPLHLFINSSRKKEDGLKTCPTKANQPYTMYNVYCNVLMLACIFISATYLQLHLLALPSQRISPSERASSALILKLNKMDKTSWHLLLQISSLSKTLFLILFPHWTQI